MTTDTREALPPKCEPPRFFELLFELAQTNHISENGITCEAMNRIRAALATQPAQPDIEARIAALSADRAYWRKKAMAAQPSAQGEAVAWEMLAKAGRLDRLPFAAEGSGRTEQVECVILTRNDVENRLAAMLASAPAAPAQPSAQGEAAAWLVEWKAHGHGPQWWGFNHTPGKNATWCSDANNAIRFARKEDAERMRLHIIAVVGLTGMHGYERSVCVTEHMWEGPCRVD